MKFTNGYWLLKDGISAKFATQVYEACKNEKELTVYAPEHIIQNRGNTLNTALLTARFSSPMKNIIKVSYSHFDGTIDSKAHFELNEDKNFCPKIEINDTNACIISGDLKANIKIGDTWHIEFTGKDKHLTECNEKSFGYMIKENTPHQYCFCENAETFVKEEFTMSVGEYVYGLGERFTPFIKNGQSIDIWNEDGGTASNLAYKNIPFFITNKGYGVFVNDTNKVSFEIASEKASRIQFSVPGEKLEYFIIYGETPKEIIERYTALAGRPQMLPEWSYGLWLSTSFTTNYDEKTVMSFVDGCFERNIPLSVFHFDCFWMKGFQWSDFVWDNQVFSDPKGLIQKLHDKNLKVCVWINPYIAQKSVLFAEGKEKGYFLRKKDGSVWQTDMWQAGMAIVDFTNPEACKWYESKLKVLLDMGVDAFKTDFGERIPTDCVYFNGADSKKMHNFYTYLYNKCVFSLLQNEKGKENACLFARSATTGSQKFPLHWGGDCESTFNAMAETIRGGLSLGLCGFGFWSHDIGGFEGNPMPELFKRWLQLGFLSSHSRLHGSNSYRVPWSVDEESSIVAKKFAEIKIKLKPYLLEKAKEACEKGTPIMRAMFLEFPNDKTCETLDCQYMLGDKYLVAPVLTKEGFVEYYLPQGKWRHFIDERIIDCSENGKWLKETYDFNSLPLWQLVE